MQRSNLAHHFHIKPQPQPHRPAACHIDPVTDSRPSVSVEPGVAQLRRLACNYPRYPGPAHLRSSRCAAPKSPRWIVLDNPSRQLQPLATTLVDGFHTGRLLGYLSAEQDHQKLQYAHKAIHAGTLSLCRGGRAGLDCGTYASVLKEFGPPQLDTGHCDPDTAAAAVCDAIHWIATSRMRAPAVLDQTFRRTWRNISRST
ncbi:hypothetical protein CSAL01_03733 [Colletotrichum salicis]|uniref:Uncharacterized protein n=1 Tax=Colletotrichum salicis TaxID=1209931 RepID=A0A135UGE5_9PEZI|nr:hypothetical protein CSAL01_03733 [Colletotrichum salicis]